MGPLIILIFGRDVATVAVVAGIVVLFPALVNIVLRLHSASPRMLDVVAVYGGTPWTALRTVAVPASLLLFFAAVRIPAPGALTGDIVGGTAGRPLTARSAIQTPGLGRPAGPGESRSSRSSLLRSDGHEGRPGRLTNRARATLPGSGGPPTRGTTVPSETKIAARVQGVLDIPLNRFLGMELRDPAEPAAGVWSRWLAPAQNQAAVLHGGVVMMLLDTACYLALLPHLSDDEHAVTLDHLTVLAAPPGRRRQARARHGYRPVLRPGSRVHACRGDRGRRGRRCSPGHAVVVRLG